MNFLDDLRRVRDLIKSCLYEVFQTAEEIAGGILVPSSKAWVFFSGINREKHFWGKVKLG